MRYSGHSEDSILPIASIMIEYILSPTSATEHDEFHQKYAAKRFLRASTFAHSWVRARWHEGGDVDLAKRLPEFRDGAEGLEEATMDDVESSQDTTSN